MLRKEVKDILQSRQKDFEEISDRIWEFAETSFLEVQSARLQADYMRKRGFTVTMPAAGLETGLTARWGTGRPVIAFLGEMDALPGLNQEADVTEARPTRPGAAGHGCGHNLFGAGSMEAACAVKEYLEKYRIEASVRYYGCPAEEGGGGKVYMVREGLFDDVDAVIAWHPYHYWDITVSGRAVISAYFKWEGVPAHALHPEQGRSALDALELMNIGCNFLRKLVQEDTRMSYAIIDSGDKAGNIIPHHAEGFYQIRHPDQSYLKEVFKRLVDMAEGAALMTGTKMAGPFIAGSYANYLVNDTLNEALRINMEELLPLDYTKEELEYGRGFLAVGVHPEAPEPYRSDINLGSELIHSDVCDVSWKAPLVHFFGVTLAEGTKPHNWGTVAQGKSAAAKRGMHAAARLMAELALDLIENPKLIRKAKEEFKERIKNSPPYFSLMKDCTPEDYLNPGRQKGLVL